MSFARIITSDSAAATDVAKALANSGYIVDIVSPADIAASPRRSYDLEINLDLENQAIESLPIEESAAADNKSEYEEDDTPIEREFILAPAWRKLKSRVHAWKQSILSARTKEESLQNELTLECSSPKFEAISYPEAETQPSQESLTPETLPEPVVPRPEMKTSASFESEAADNMETLIVPPVEKVQKPRRPVVDWTQLFDRLNSNLQQLLALSREKLSDFRKPLPSASPAETRHYLWRQSTPIAAGVLLSFLLGWTAATYSKPEKSNEPALVAPAVASTSTTPVHKTPAARTRARSKTSIATTHKPVAHRHVRPADADTADTDDDVVIRHYPSKAVTAQNRSNRPTNGPKRFSDLSQ